MYPLIKNQRKGKVGEQRQGEESKAVGAARKAERGKDVWRSGERKKKKKTKA
jgi:hypothetical protein